MIEVCEDRVCDTSSGEGSQLGWVMHLERPKLLWIEVPNLADVREAGSLQVLEEQGVRQPEVMEHVLDVEAPLSNEVSSVVQVVPCAEGTLEE